MLYRMFWSKVRYLSEWIGLRYTTGSKWQLGERLMNRSKNRRHPSFTFSLVNWMELSIMFRCVKNSDNFDFFVITKPSTYIPFHKHGDSIKVSKTRVSMLYVVKNIFLRKPTWISGRNIDKIITTRLNLSAWFETWWQMLCNNMSSKRTALNYSSSITQWPQNTCCAEQRPLSKNAQVWLAQPPFEFFIVNKARCQPSCIFLMNYSCQFVQDIFLHCFCSASTHWA